MQLSQNPPEMQWCSSCLSLEAQEGTRQTPLEETASQTCQRNGQKGPLPSLPDFSIAPRSSLLLIGQTQSTMPSCEAFSGMVISCHTHIIFPKYFFSLRKLHPGGYDCFILFCLVLNEREREREQRERERERENL